MAIVSGLGLLALGGMFAAVGLDDADKIASIVGGITGLFGLGLTIYNVWFAAPGAPGGQQLSDSAVDGNAVQMRGVRGKVSVKNSAPRPGRRQPHSGAGTATVQPSGQEIGGSTVGGHSMQFDRVDGDIDLEQ